MSLTIQGVLTVLGRVMLGTIFLSSALGNKIPNFDGVVQSMQNAGVPFPQVMLIGAIVFLIAGSVSIFLGYKARFGAGMLFLFLLMATWYFHAFWTFEGQEQQMQTIQFMKNLSMAGALLLIMANGPGLLALDNRSEKTTARRADMTGVRGERRPILN